ncbi:MAG: thioredoxin domain-containing protein [Dehalobacterium sp.]
MTCIPFPSITADNFDTLTFDSAIPVLVFFGAERCQVCKELLPTVEEIASELAEKMNFYWVDVDAYKSLSTRFRLRGIPQILVFNDGEIKERIGGLAEKEAILEKINSVLAK